MGQNTYTGYLVIADISGYTSYVATTELEHSQEVLAELLELIVARFQPALTILRLEGDAVFAHAPEGQIPRGETLVECLESTYTVFRDHIRGIVHRTTCECNACRAIPTLDLKFIVHYGNYIMQQVSGIKELVGTEVNRLFRLTKNHVTQETGWNAYILYTAASLEQIGIEPEGMHEQVESYEHLGEVTIYVTDLHARFEEISAARHVVLLPEDAHVTFTFDFAAPPPVVWEWLNDPRRRNLADPHVTWSAVNRPGGRTGVGASNHCAHGKNGLTSETILDWRPFEYVTSLKTNNKMPDKLIDMMETVSLEPIGDGSGTRAQWNTKLQRLPGFVARAMGKIYIKQMREDYLEPMNQLIQEEQGQAASPPADAVPVVAEGDTAPLGPSDSAVL
jgi:hypothetical protein